MKKGILILLAAGFLFAEARSQENEVSFNEKSHFTLGFQIGYDKNFNAYKMGDDIFGFTYYEIQPSFSAGIDIGYFVTKRFRPRIEFEYSYLMYGMDWNMGEDADFLWTRTNVHNWGLNGHFDYGIYMGDRVQVFLSPGISWDWNFHYKHWTTLADEDDKVDDEYSLFQNEFPTSILGGSLSMPVRINLSDKLKLDLEPEVTTFFRYFDSSNTEPYGRFSFKVGLEYTL